MILLLECVKKNYRKRPFKHTNELAQFKISRLYFAIIIPAFHVCKNLPVTHCPVDPRVHLQDERAMRWAAGWDMPSFWQSYTPVRHPRGLLPPHVLLKQSALPWPKDPTTAFSFSVFLCRAQLERGRQKGFSPVLIPFHGPFPKGVSSLYLKQTNKQNKKYSCKRFYLRKVDIGKQCCPLTSEEEREEKSQMQAGRSSRRAACPPPSAAAARDLD